MGHWDHLLTPVLPYRPIRDSGGDLSAMGEFIYPVAGYCAVFNLSLLTTTNAICLTFDSYLQCCNGVTLRANALQPACAAFLEAAATDVLCLVKAC